MRRRSPKEASHCAGPPTPDPIPRRRCRQCTCCGHRGWRAAPRLALRSNSSSCSIRLRRHHSTRPVVVAAACWRAAVRRRAGRHKSCWRASAAGAAALRIREDTAASCRRVERGRHASSSSRRAASGAALPFSAWHPAQSCGCGQVQLGRRSKAARMIRTRANGPARGGDEGQGKEEVAPRAPQRSASAQRGRASSHFMLQSTTARSTEKHEAASAAANETAERMTSCRTPAERPRERVLLRLRGQEL
jgi:hypothetical protein